MSTGVMTTSRMRGGVIQRGGTWSRTSSGKVTRRRTDDKPHWVGGFPTQKRPRRPGTPAPRGSTGGTYVAPQNLTVGEWLDRWIAAHEVELKPSTAKSYRDNIARYLKPALGPERLQSLSPSRLSIVFKRLYESGGKDGKPLSPRTVEFARAVLRRALQDAVVDRILEVNPVVGTKRPEYRSLSIPPGAALNCRRSWGV